MSEKEEKTRDRKNAVSFVRSLSEKEFVEFFYDATAERSFGDVAEYQNHLIIADSESIDGEAWETDFLALPEERAHWSADAPICQSGKCGKCTARVRSWAKNALCPICGKAVYCT